MLQFSSLWYELTLPIGNFEDKKDKKKTKKDSEIGNNFTPGPG